MNNEIVNDLKIFIFALLHSVAMGAIYLLFFLSLVLLSPTMSIILGIVFVLTILALTVLYVKIKIEKLGIALLVNVVLIPMATVALVLLGFPASILRLFGIEELGNATGFLLIIVLIFSHIEYVITIVIYFICKIIGTFKRKNTNKSHHTHPMYKTIVKK